MWLLLKLSLNCCLHVVLLLQFYLDTIGGRMLAELLAKFPSLTLSCAWCSAILTEFDYVAFFGQWDNSKYAPAEIWKVFACWDLSFAARDPFCSYRKKTTIPMETHSSVDSSDYQHQPPELGQSIPIDTYSWLQAWEWTRARRVGLPNWVQPKWPTHSNFELISYCSFTPIHFRVVCSIAILEQDWLFRVICLWGNGTF